MKTSFTIIGSCVSNQIIRCAAKKNQNPYLVKGATTLINPYTLGTPTIEGIAELFDVLEYDTDMTKQSTKLAFQKDFESFCRGKWLILDFSTLNVPILEFESSLGEKYYISERPICDISSQNMRVIYEFASQRGYTVKRIENPLFFYSEEHQCALLQKLASKVLEIYEPSHIIFANTSYFISRIRADKTLDPIGFNKKHTEKLHLLTQKNQEFFCSCLNLDDSHIIKVPHNAMADDDSTLHANGSPTHYSSLYYDYGLEALNIITDQLTQEETIKKLQIIYDDYVRKFEHLKINSMENSCCSLNRLKNVSSYNYCLGEYINGYKGTFLEAIRNRYNLKKIDIPFIECNDLNEYINCLLEANSNYIIFVSAKETANKYWDNWKTAKKIGLTAELSKAKRKSYCAVIDLGKGHVIEKFDNTNSELMFDYQIFVDEPFTSYFSNQRNSCVSIMPHMYYCSISSKAKHKESQYMWARIMINNIDYSINKIGLNFVIFSPDEQCVVDSFYVNFWNDKNLMIRRS